MFSVCAVTRAMSKKQKRGLPDEVDEVEFAESGCLVSLPVVSLPVLSPPSVVTPAALVVSHTIEEPNSKVCMSR